MAASWPEANLFPLGWESDFEALALDIHLHGQRLPIVWSAGKLVDGRRRWLACRRLGLAPAGVEVALPDAGARLIAVASFNAHRRIQAEGPLAMALAKAVTYARREGVAVTGLASAAQLRPQRVYEALRVIAFRPDLVEPVARGQRNLYAAFKEASAEARRQRAGLAPRPAPRPRGRPRTPLTPEQLPRRWGALWEAAQGMPPAALTAALPTETQAAIALQRGLDLRAQIDGFVAAIRRRWPGLNAKFAGPPTR